LVAAGAFGAHPVRFMMVGDSLAVTMAIGLEVKSVSRFGVRVINHETLGCDLDDLKAIVSGNIADPVSNCRFWRTLWPKYVAQSKPEVVGMLMGRWDITNHLENGHVVHIGQTGWDDHLYEEIDQAVKIFSAHGAKVVLFTMPFIDPPEEAANGTPFPENDPVRVTEFNAILDRVASHNGQTVTVVDLNKQLDPEGKFQTVVEGTAVRWPDGIHISKPGGEWLQPFVLPTVAQLGLVARGAGAGT
jgi:hypothetical protein